MAPTDRELRLGPHRAQLSNAVVYNGEVGTTLIPLMGDQREFDLETRVTTNGNNKTPRCFTVVH